MEKYNLYKFQDGCLDTFEELLNVDRSDGYIGQEEDYGVVYEGIHNEVEVYIYKNTLEMTGVTENRFKFLNLSRTKKDTSYVVVFRKEDQLFWIRRGQYAVNLDKYKNTNFPMYYLSNISDLENYKYTKVVEKEFNLINGETNKGTHIEVEKEFKPYIQDLINNNKALFGISLKIGVNTEIGIDLGLTKEETIEFHNGITIIGSFDTFTDLENICNVINCVLSRHSDYRTKLKPMNRSGKKVFDIDWREIDCNSMFKITSAENNNIELLNTIDLSSEGKTNKKLIGYFQLDDENKYVVTQSQKIYRVDFDEAETRDFINTNDIIREIGLTSYKSEDDYLKRIETIDNANYYIHSLHPRHYHENNRSKFELCDIFVYDKAQSISYLIYAKYKIHSSSSEVFWQSTLVADKFYSGKMNETKLREFLLRYGVKEEYANLNTFINSKFISLILPERGNNNTEHLMHIFNLLKHSEHQSNMAIWIPNTMADESDREYTKII